MYKPDFQLFRELLNEQARIFRKDAPDDVMVQAYWNALKDVSLDAVQACAAVHLKRGKFFPKPAELRPKGDSGKDVVKSEPIPPDALALNERVWREKLQTPRGKLEYRYCQLQRILASSPLDSPQYAEALAESRRFHREHGDPRFWA